MRVKHLTDSEIQSQSLIRESGKDISTEPQTPAETQMRIHLANCYLCQEKMELYSTLDIELKSTPRTSLPRDFARRVTLSLPPFMASRKKAIRQLIIGWSAASVLMLGWLLTRVDWMIVILGLSDIPAKFFESGSIFLTTTKVLVSQFEIPLILLVALHSSMEFSTELISSVAGTFNLSTSVISVAMGAALILATVELFTNTLYGRLRIDKPIN